MHGSYLEGTHNFSSVARLTERVTQSLLSERCKGIIGWNIGIERRGRLCLYDLVLYTLSTKCSAIDSRLLAILLPKACITNQTLVSCLFEGPNVLEHAS